MFFNHSLADLCVLDQGPLAGLRHRTVIDGEQGAADLALWQEEHESGFHVPPHRHDCEEIITVVEGAIRATIEDTDYVVSAWQSVLIGAWALHGFEVTSETPVKLLAIFSSKNPRIFRANGVETTPPWLGGSSAHLQENGD